MPYQLRMFGGWALSGTNGSAIDTVRPHSNVGALLSVLGTRPPEEPVSRDELVALLWPESPERRARNSLRVTLSKLREVLPGGALGGEGREWIWLDPSVVASDVRRFEEALAEDRPGDALDLYGGPFLEHVHLSGAGAFNRWAEERRGHYRRKAYEAALVTGAGAQEEERLPRAEEAYRRALDLEPFKEEAAAALMRVLARQGKRADALRLYEAFTERLTTELDLSPSDQLEEMSHRIRSEPTDAAIESGSAGSSAGEGPAPAEAAAPSEAPPPEPSWRRGPLAWGAALLMLGVLGLGAWILARGTESGPPVATDRTIAVLPFEVLGQEREDDFARGIHASLITRLAGVSGLHVISGTSARRYEETDKSLPEIARELNAGWVLEGEVQRIGESVRMNAQLVDARRDVHVWAESYHRDSLTARNSFEIQAALTRRIAEALEVELGPEEERRVEAVPTENTAAYELYLQARKLDRTSPTTARVTDRRIELYRRALTLDSSFAAAWAGLADAFVGRALLTGTEAWADSGRRVARRAIELDPDLGYAYAQIGDALWTLGELDSATSVYRKALEIQPDSREPTNNLLVLVSRRGELAEKARLLDRLLRTSPRSSEVVGNLVELNVTLGRDSVADAWRRYARSRDISLAGVEFGLALFARGDTEAAEEYLKALPGDPRVPFLSRRRSALALYRGDWIEARERYRALYSSPSGASHPIFLGLLEDRLGLAWALDRLGQQQEARAIADRVLEDSTSRREGPDAYLYHRPAVARLIRGDTVRALDRLDEAVERGYRFRRTLQNVPTLEPLRDHPRFERLLARIDSLVAEERRRIEAKGWAEPPELVVGDDRSGIESSGLRSPHYKDALPTSAAPGRGRSDWIGSGRGVAKANPGSDASGGRRR